MQRFHRNNEKILKAKRISSKFSLKFSLFENFKYFLVPEQIAQITMFIQFAIKSDDKVGTLGKMLQKF